MSEQVTLPGPIVSGEWLAEHLDQVAVLDARAYLDGRSGRDAYDRGHIPTAQWIDREAALSAPPSAEEGRHPLPPAAQVNRALERLGIAPDRPVVVYDDASGSVAARAWWLLGAAVAVLIPTLLYYGGGWLQYGYRYFLDSVPFVIALCGLAAVKQGRIGYGWLALIALGTVVTGFAIYWVDKI